MEEEEIYDDIRLTKRKTITNGEKYNFYIYDMMKLEKKFSKGKFGKGDTVISPVKNYKLLDEETGEPLPLGSSRPFHGTNTYHYTQTIKK